MLRAKDAEALSSFYIKVLQCIGKRVANRFNSAAVGSILIDIVDADSELGLQGGPSPGQEEI